MIDPKRLVHSEKSVVNEAAAGSFLVEWFASHSELVTNVFAKRGRLSRDAMERHAKKTVAYARGCDNVVYSDLQGTPKHSGSKKPWFETFNVLVEMNPDSNGSRFTLIRTGARYEMDAAVCSMTDDHFDVTVHMPERLVERAGVSAAAIRTTARALVGSAGFFALGARYWSTFPSDDGYKTNVAFPVYGGLAASCSEFGSQHGIVQPNGSPLGLKFVGMTYIAGSDIGPVKERALRAMTAFGRRHPVLPVLGLHLLFPYSKCLNETVRKLAPQVEKAYADMVLLFDDEDVCKVFRLSAKPGVAPPLPWHEDMAKRRIHVGRTDLPVFPSAQQLKDARIDTARRCLDTQLNLCLRRR
jgi:hypothetical protein